jgi:hypothetical protein
VGQRDVVARFVGGWERGGAARRLRQATGARS